MVASAKMRKAQQSALAGRPYAKLMNSVLAAVSAGAGEFTSPLIEVREVKKRALVIISTDKGLCGGLNTNLLREATKYDKVSTVHVTAGRKASQYVARTKRELAAEFTYKDSPTFAEARAISKFAQDLFTSGKVDQVDVLYTNFISTMVQKPDVRQFLPIVEITAVDADVQGEGAGKSLEQNTTEYLFEPAADVVMGSLLPHYLNFQIYQFLLEAKASEHSARMVAMKSATDNANDMIKALGRLFNRSRQSQITTELTEIMGGAAALE